MGFLDQGALGTHEVLKNYERMTANFDQIPNDYGQRSNTFVDSRDPLSFPEAIYLQVVGGEGRKGKCSSP